MDSDWSVSIEGEFCLRGRDGREVRLTSRTLCALIGLCALKNPMVQKRRDLAAWLWPNDPAESASTSLRQLLTQARRVLGARCLLADREEVRLVGIQRILGRGAVMPGFNQPPFCRARSLQSEESGTPAANAFCTAADYLAENSPHSLGDFLLASQPLLGLLPTTKSADLVALALPHAQSEAQKANLHYALGYFLCMASRLHSAGDPLKIALDYASESRDLNLKAKTEEMLMHRAILTGRWDTAARLADSASPFAQLVYFEHRGNRDYRLGRKGDFLRSGELSARESAVAALFCITGNAVESWRPLADQAQMGGTNSWDMEALLALGEGFRFIVESSFEKAKESFEKVVAKGEFGQSRDFVRYGTEGLLRVAELTGEVSQKGAAGTKSAEIRQAVGLKVTAWDRARLSLTPH